MSFSRSMHRHVDGAYFPPRLITFPSPISFWPSSVEKARRGFPFHSASAWRTWILGGCINCLWKTDSADIGRRNVKLLWLYEPQISISKSMNTYTLHNHQTYESNLTIWIAQIKMDTFLRIRLEKWKQNIISSVGIVGEKWRISCTANVGRRDYKKQFPSQEQFGSSYQKP